MQSLARVAPDQTRLFFFMKISRGSGGRAPGRERHWFESQPATGQPPPTIAGTQITLGDKAQSILIRFVRPRP